METMNMDDISAVFSNLDIAFAAEKNGLTVQEAAITHTFPRSDGVQRRFPFLSLPWQAKWRVYAHLQSRDCIALSSTCHQMYRFNTFAYTHLQLLPPNSLFSLARTVCKLGAVLVCSPQYAEAVRTIRIVGWTTPDVPEGWDREAVYKALDKGIVGLLEYGRHVYSLTLDLNLTKALNYFPKTLSALAQVRTIRALRLTPFFPPTYYATAPESGSPSLYGVPGDEPPAYEQVSLDVCSGGWLPMMMRDPRKLRWFGLSIADKDWQPGDVSWALTLRRVAEAATGLETLVLSGGQHFDADILGQTLRIGFSRGVLGRLRSISVDTDTLSIVALTQLFSGFPCSSVTHVRIVVNHYGRWPPDFGPRYVMELAKLIPDLEELSLDQKGMPVLATLPGCLNAWGEAFRMFKKLRRIAFASMFILDVCGPRVAFGDVEEDDEYEEEEEEPNGRQDNSMDLDESYDSDDDSVSESDEGEILASNIGHLAVWADMFFDEHLRMLPPFGEIWFLDNRFAGHIAAGYNQLVMMGEDGRAEHVIHYPSTRKRDGWWWNENDPTPLD